MMQQFSEGQTRTSRRTGEVQVFSGGQWVSQGRGASGATASPAAPSAAPSAPPGYRAVPFGGPPPGRDIELARDQIGLQRDQVGLETARVNLAQEQAERATGANNDSTGDERKSAGFLLRALDANRNYERSDIGPRSAVGEVLQNYAPRVLNNLPRAVGNSSARQSSDALQEDFIRATLRYESGAVLGPDELATQRSTYFPVAGDTPETIATKRQLRINAMRALGLSAGRSLTPELQQQIEAFVAGEQQQGGDAAPPAFQPGDNAPAVERPTAVDQRVMEPGAPQQTVDANPTYTEQTDPALAGLNDRVAQMFQQRRPMGEVVRYIRERGVNLNARAMARLREIQQFQRNNPGYRGGYNVDLESEMVPNSAVRQALGAAAASPVGTAAGTYLDDITGGHLDNIVNTAGGDGELLNLGLRELQSRNPGSAIVGHMGAGASLYGAGRAIAGRIAGAALPSGAGALSPTAVAGDAALGAYIGSGQDGTDPFSVGGATAGAVGGAGGGVVGRGAINTVARAVSPSGGELAPLYRAGVNPTMGQRMGGVVDRAEQAFTSVPLVGGVQRSARNNTIQEFQRGAFNQALGEIGQELPRGTIAGRAAHKFTQRAFRTEFDGARRQMQFSPDPQFGNDLGRIQLDVDALPDSVKSSFERIVRNELGGRLRGGGGTLSGDSYIRAISRLEDRARAVRRRPDGQELAEALDSVVEAIDDAAARQSPQAAVDQLARARAGYARLVVIEDAARRRGGGVGEFTPTQFDAAVQNVSGGVRSRRYLSGDALMQDYATAGMRLGNTVADSGTGERIMTMGGLGALGHFIDPIALAPYAANTAANLPGFRQTLGALLAPNRTQLDPVRQALMDRSQYGGLLLAGPAAGAASQ